jgi:hypothetical protein
MPSNLLQSGTEELFENVFDEVSGDVYLVDPSEEVLRSVVNVGAASDGDGPTVHVVANERLTKDVMDDFLVAADAADLVDEGTMSLRVLDEEMDNTLLVTEDQLYAIVTATDTVGALAAGDAGFIGDAYGTYSDLWDRAEEFALRTPPLSTVRSTMEESIGETVRSDFDEMLAALDTARGDGDGLDEVTISLLVAGMNEALLYDISKWGEDVGIASKATFSRTKTELEDVDVIDTEKVPIDVGRPRLRLKIGDPDLVDADAAELAAKVQEIMG